MTRTERSSYPRAINKDRSESRTGLDKRDRKGGAGGHNWGSIQDEIDYEVEETLKEKYDEEYEGKELGVSVSKRSEMSRNKGLGENVTLADIASSSKVVSNPNPSKDVEITRDAPTANVA